MKYDKLHILSDVGGKFSDFGDYICGIYDVNMCVICIIRTT